MVSRTLEGPGTGAEDCAMGILKIIGAAIIVVWLLLWLALKITFGAIHLLALLGLALVIVGFVKASRLSSKDKVYFARSAQPLSQPGVASPP